MIHFFEKRRKIDSRNSNDNINGWIFYFFLLKIPFYVMKCDWKIKM